MNVSVILAADHWPVKVLTVTECMAFGPFRILTMATFVAVAEYRTNKFLLYVSFACLSLIALLGSSVVIVEDYKLQKK